MNFREFQHSRVWTSSIADATGFAITGNTQGYIYCTQSGIFDVHPELHIFAPDGQFGPFEMELGRTLVKSSVLEPLERALHTEAINEGWIRGE